MRTKALLSFPYLFVYKDTISAKRLSSISAFVFQEEETSWGFKGFRFQISVSWKSIFLKLEQCKYISLYILNIYNNFDSTVLFAEKSNWNLKLLKSETLKTGVPEVLELMQIHKKKRSDCFSFWVAEARFERTTFGLWAQRATTAPLRDVYFWLRVQRYGFFWYLQTFPWYFFVVPILLWHNSLNTNQFKNC